jgi:hypothetical protein
MSKINHCTKTGHALEFLENQSTPLVLRFAKSFYEAALRVGKNWPKLAPQTTSQH